MGCVKAIPANEAVHVWDEARQHLSKALNRIDTGYSDEDLLTAIQMRDMQLWMVPGQAAAVTQIQIFPQFKTLVILYLGGEQMSEWIEELMDTFEEYGRFMGCKYAEQYGRKGWERVARDRGAKTAFTVVRKAL